MYKLECYACFGHTFVHDDGTPGSVHDMIQRRLLETGSVNMSVVDEADGMFSIYLGNP